MRIFLFLYPSFRYLDLKRVGGAERLYEYSGLNRMIDERYRRSGYTVVWMINGCEDNHNIPDRSNIPPFYDLHSDDLVISTGHPERFGQEFRRANPEHVLSQIPFPVDEFCLGGFHLKDCVARFAAELEALNLSVRVDPEVTDRFFARVNLARLGLSLEETS